MADILLFSLQLALGIALPWIIVRRDLRRLDAERLGRAWNDASFWCSIVVFGPLCLPFHFTKTRRNVIGLLLGLAWMLAAVAVTALIAEAIGALLGVE